MSGRSRSAVFATESLSLVELWHGVSSCLSEFDLEGKTSHSTLLYESPDEWLLDEGIRPTDNNVGQLVDERMGLAIDFTVSMSAWLYCSLFIFPSFPDASDDIHRRRYSVTLSFGTMLDRQLYPFSYTDPAEKAPLQDLTHLTLALASALNATAFMVIANDECTLAGLTAEAVLSWLRATWEAPHEDRSIGGIEEIPGLLGISTDIVSRQEFYCLIGEGTKDCITESLSGYLIYDLMKYGC